MDVLIIDDIQFLKGAASVGFFFDLFNYLKEQTQATSGNLSVQIDKLSAAGYIDVRKEIVGRKTRTSCRLTDKGRAALDNYVASLKEYLGEIL